VSRRKPPAVVVISFVAAVSVLTLATHTALAQQGSAPGPPPPGERDPFAEARERQQREARLRSAEMLGGVKSVDRRGAEAAAEQMREDFKNIQVLRNKLARHLLSEATLDYKFIADEAKEINKLAERLKARLLREAPEEEKKEPVKQAEFDGGGLKDALVRMCQRIDSFTENPVFKLPDVVDVEQSAKAGHDLLEVIQLSGDIRKAAENKAKGKRQKAKGSDQ